MQSYPLNHGLWDVFNMSETGLSNDVLFHIQATPLAHHGIRFIACIFTMKHPLFNHDFPIVSQQVQSAAP